MPTATRIKQMSDWRGDAAVYRLSPPINYRGWAEVDGEYKEVERSAEFVIVSAAWVPHSGPETYIFRSNSEGGEVDWCEMRGSIRGVLDHKVALKGAGYDTE